MHAGRGQVRRRSTVGTLPALAGMWPGRAVRRRISPPTFRLVLFGALLMLGTELAIRGLA